MDIGECVLVDGNGFNVITHPASHEVISIVPGSVTFKLWEIRGRLFAELPAERSVDHFNDFVSVARALEWLQHRAYRDHKALTPAKRRGELLRLEKSLRKSVLLLSAIDNATLDDLDGEVVDAAGVFEVREKMKELGSSIALIIDGGIDVSRTNTKRDDLYDVVDVLGRIYERRTGKRPTNPSYVIEDRQEKEGLDGAFYQLCKLVTSLVDPSFAPKLQHVIREVVQDL